MTERERGQYRFAAKEGAGAEFWIAAEPVGDDSIGSLDGRILGFELWPQATMNEAKALADALNQNIWAITLT